MKDSAVLVLARIVDTLEEAGVQDIQFFNIALDSFNKFKVEIRNSKKETAQILMEVSPRDFSLLKPYILKTNRKCLFFTKRDTCYEQTSTKMWSKIARNYEPFRK